ncbi:MAG: PH domain-containing protein [Bacteroidia bacterium]|nr:PH domain-containing protein [Bacteroidia bacterium]
MDNPTIVIKTATFSPKVKTYIFLVVLWFLLISVIGWIILPFWLCGLGQWLSKKFYHTLKCELTNKNLRFSKGLILHIEKTIPLENIQDISFVGGPVLRAFGLTIVKVETAGGGGAHASNQMSMIGMDDSEIFKGLILEYREKLMKEKNRIVTVGSGGGENLNEKILVEIKNELVEIKNILNKK